MSAVDLPAAIAATERFQTARDRRAGLQPAARTVIARAWCGPGDRDYAELTEDALCVLLAAARAHLAGPAWRFEDAGEAAA